ncbi:MAG: cysteate synthase [Terriglobales bacterium]
MSYKLRCSACGLLFDDDGFMLACPGSHPPALLTTLYASRTLASDPLAAGMYRFRCWLPDANRLNHAASSVTYQSKRLSSALGLPNLWIAFSGYWPERGATLETATFKELEVGGVLSRIPANAFRALVVASAGNTAAAFARSCSENNVPCLIVVPESGMGKLRFSNRLESCVKLVCLTDRAGYSDAIAFAERISRESGFVGEGGVKNVGRRDGMGTVVLNAAETIGRLPDYYFQAIGSGAGAIAAHEAAKRLVEDSRFGLALPRLMLSQNAPFAPIHHAWKKGCRELDELDPDRARALTEGILATVLSNHRPPYSLPGGVFDVLSQSHGDMFAVQNEEALQAMKLFENSEGIDIDPAAGVALASLTRAARSGQIDGRATVLLHITGGGARKRALEKSLFAAPPDLKISLRELGAGAALETACALFRERESDTARCSLKAVSGR